jgi:hypothetical protein
LILEYAVVIGFAEQALRGLDQFAVQRIDGVAGYGTFLTAECD